MFRRPGHTLVIVTLVVMLGGHWAVLQTVAWANMLTDNLRSGSISDAVGRTFDGKHPCCLCKAIETAKKSEKKSQASFHLKKLEFVSKPLIFVFCAPLQFDLLPSLETAFAHVMRKPDVPPPRHSSAC